VKPLNSMPDRHRLGRGNTSPVVVVVVALALCAAVVATACDRRRSTGAAGAGYRPFYSMPAGATPQARGTLKGDFDRAMSAPTVDEAATRWTEFLRAHEPADGEYEDGFQRDHVRVAQYELMRIEYLRGRVEEGDKLLRKLEDVLRTR